MEDEATGFLPAYFTDPFSSTLWLKEWSQFTDLIAALCNDPTIGKYVVQTDIANFYDSIELPKLFRRLRRDAVGNEHYIEALEVFLGHWNRGSLGYGASSKGIPQEIISDASRVLSHYYLQRFDVAFSEYCVNNGLTYIRWADDFHIFGNIKYILERAVHQASREIMIDGLNMNAAKTMLFTRSGYAKFRGVKLLKAINDKNRRNFCREIVKCRDLRSKGVPQRLDTIFRASVGYTKKLSPKVPNYVRQFIFELADKEFDLVMSLNARQLTNLILISDDPEKYYRSVIRRLCSKPFAAQKATVLLMLRKYRSELAAIGLTKKDMLWAIELVKKSTNDSRVVQDWSRPAAELAFA